MKLLCRSCAKPIPAADVHLERAIAKCRACNAVFSFADTLDGPERRAAIDRRPRVEQPRGMTLDRGAEGLVIERRWYTPSAWGMVLFCALWDGFLIVWYSMALASDEAPLMMLVFPLLHVAVGVGLLYYVLALFCNRTWISASRGRLEIRHGPVPWPGSCELEASSIQQLFCKERFHRSKHGGHHTYALHAIVRGQGKRQLVSGLSDPDDAIFLEQQLESHLGIEDRKVSDELRR